MLLRKGADHCRLSAVEGSRQRGLRGRESIPTERFAPLVEFLGIARDGQRRARIADAARTFKLVGAGPAGDAERPFNLRIIGLKIVVADRPISQRRAFDLARDGPDTEIVRREPRQPTLPMHGSAAHHLGHRAEHLKMGFLLRRRARRARIEQRVRPEIVSVDIREFIAAERLPGPPRSALQRDDAHAALGKNLGGGGARGASADDANIRSRRLRLTRHGWPPDTFPLRLSRTRAGSRSVR